MAGRRSLAVLWASAAVALAVAPPVQAQGRGNSQVNGHKSTPPSSVQLPSPSTGPAATAPPVAWLDDASLLTPGTMALTVGLMHWTGADLSETDIPIVSASVGLAPRFQIGASVPHILGSADGTGAVGGVGTSYIDGKIALLPGAHGVKLTVSPTLQILGSGAAQAVAAGQSRTKFGLPASLELSQGLARVYASTGFFSSDSWFVGGGAGFQVTSRIGLAIAFTRAWSNGGTTGVTGDRRELSGGLSYVVRPQIAFYGSVGQTIATTDENGAGTNVGGGVTFTLRPRFTH
jgi:hypothetical protein